MITDFESFMTDECLESQATAKTYHRTVEVAVDLEQRDEVVVSLQRRRAYYYLRARDAYAALLESEKMREEN